MPAMTTSEQRRKAGRLLEEALKHQPRDVVQRALGDVKLKAKLLGIFQKLGDLPFADEEVESKYGYPKGFRFRNPAKQVMALKAIFPLLGFQLWKATTANSVVTSRLLHNMEFKAVIPDFRAIAAISQDYRAEMSEIEAYCLATNIVVQRLKELHGDKFHNYQQGALTPKHLRLTEKLSKAHEQLRATHGKLWIVDAQFGKLHAGRSVRRVRVCMRENEFGFGPYEVAILLLTHPDRITGWFQLSLKCAGVELSQDASGYFYNCFAFCWHHNDRLVLFCGGINEDVTDCGSVSGALPPHRS